MTRRRKLVPHVRVAESAVLLVLAAFLLAAAACISHLGQTVSEIYDQANTVSNNTTYVAQVFRGQCSLSDGRTKGRRLFDPAQRSSICIPDGWQLFKNSGSNMIIASASGSDGLVYRPGVVPMLGSASGQQGPFTFQLHDYSGDPGAPAGFTKVGSFQATNATGTEYSFVQKTNPVGGYLGNVPKGTKGTEYYFAKQGHAVVLDYWLFPGDPNHATEVRQIAQSLTLF